MITIIAAVAANRAIGFENKLLYWLPNDLKRLKTLTTGHTIVMGRRTFESLPKGALPNRRNVVITRQTDYAAPNIEVFHSFDEALQACATDEEVFIIGGESVYEAALPKADRLCLTHIEATPDEADTFFPAYDASQWIIESEEHYQPDEKNRLPYSFINYIRK